MRGERFHDDLLLRGHRIIIPCSSLQQETLQRSTVDTKKFSGATFMCRHPFGGLVSIKTGEASQQELSQVCQDQCASRTMITSTLPSHPWEKVVSNLLQLNGKTYLLVADCFSADMEYHVLVCDNGPQYNATEMQEFAALVWLSEWWVKTAKSLLAKSADPYLALLSYRATPLPCEPVRVQHSTRTSGKVEFYLKS